MKIAVSCWQKYTSHKELLIISLCLNFAYLHETPCPEFEMNSMIRTVDTPINLWNIASTHMKYCFGFYIIRLHLLITVTDNLIFKIRQLIYQFRTRTYHFEFVWRWVNFFLINNFNFFYLHFIDPHKWFKVITSIVFEM